MVLDRLQILLYLEPICDDPRGTLSKLKAEWMKTATQEQVAKLRELLANLPWNRKPERTPVGKKRKTTRPSGLTKTRKSSKRR